MDFLKQDMTSQITGYRWRRLHIVLSVMAIGAVTYIFIQLSGRSGSVNSSGGEERGTVIAVDVKRTESPVQESLQCRRALAKQEKDGGHKTEKSFLELAKESKTSKVTDVKYQCIYEEALAPYRHVNGLKILEIGLGCGMPYGPGGSYTLWSSYFSDPHITFFEFDGACGSEWFDNLNRNLSSESTTTEFKSKFKLPTMVYGDMTNEETLQKLAHNHGPFDIIIDDGCHNSICQISAFQSLFQHVNPGGIYFLEDLFAWTAWPNDKTISKITQLFTMSIAQTYAKHLMVDLEYDWKVKGLGARVERLTCCDAICGFWVKS